MYSPPPPHIKNILPMCGMNDNTKPILESQFKKFTIIL
jgi:hypothetical protein